MVNGTDDDDDGRSKFSLYELLTSRIHKDYYYLDEREVVSRYVNRIRADKMCCM